MRYHIFFAVSVMLTCSTHASEFTGQRQALVPPLIVKKFLSNTAELNVGSCTLFSRVKAYKCVLGDEWSGFYLIGTECIIDGIGYTNCLQISLRNPYDTGISMPGYYYFLLKEAAENRQKKASKKNLLPEMLFIRLSKQPPKLRTTQTKLKHRSRN